VKLQMRPETSSTLKVDAAATVIVASTTLSGAHILPTPVLMVADTTGLLDEGVLLIAGQYVTYDGRTASSFTGCVGGIGQVAGGTVVAQAGGVRYDWATADVDMADAGAAERADYVAWWEVTSGGKTQKTPPFQIVLVDLAFGSVNLCSLMDVRELLEHTDGARARDPLIEALIPVASRHLMNEAEREFAPAVTAAVRTFRVLPSRRTRTGFLVPLVPPASDLRSATLVRLHPESGSPSTLTAGTDYVLDPHGAPQGVYTTLILSGTVGLGSQTLTAFGHALIEVTGNWGFLTVPGPVRDAAAETVRSWVQRVPIALLAEAEEPRQIAPFLPGSFGLPPIARQLLRPYRRYAGAF